MHKKMVSLWRYLRTPVLLTSATVFVIGCASKNPLIDEAEPSEDTEKVSVATDKTDRTEDNAPLAADAGVHESAAQTSPEPDTLSEPARMEELPKSDSMVAPSPAAQTVRQNNEISEKSDTRPKQVETERRHPDNAVASSPAPQTVLQDNEVAVTSRTVSELSLMEQPRRQTVIEPIPAINTARQDETLAENDLNNKPTGLKKWLNMLSPYKLNIQQGNFVSSEMLSRVQYGMTKEQVRFVLGTPLLMDIFHANRWDYLFRLQKPNGTTTTNRVTIFFSGNLVDRIMSDNLPNEKEYLMHITSDDEVSDKTKKETDTEAATKETAETAETTARESVGASAAATADARKETASAAEPSGTSETAADTVEAQPSESAGSAEPQQARKPSDDTATSDDSDDTSRAAQVAPVTVTQPALRPSGAIRLPRASGASGPARVQQPRSAPAGDQTPATRTRDAARAAPEPVALPSPEPVRTPEPVSTSEPVRAAEPSVPSSQTKRIVRPLPRPPAQTDYEDEEETSSGNIGAFEPISTPNRAGRMLPHSPNDELIGNIQ